MKKILVLGAGHYGTALAHILTQKGHEVTLWGRDPKVLDSIKNHRRNPRYLTSVVLAPFDCTTELESVLDDRDILLFAIPAQGLRSLLQQLDSLVWSRKIIVNTAKGIEKETLMLPHQIFADVLGPDVVDRYVSLSGPTFALELAQGQPSGLACVSKNREMVRLIQQELSTDFLRLYTGSDVMGVELGGALKNVMAIATGIAEGLGFGFNTRAGLITRCLNEMTHLGMKMGANPLTFAGLSGVGDLVLTCTGDLSRNRHVGMELGRGKKIGDILAQMDSVAEGVETSHSVFCLMKKYTVEMPNAYYVYKIIYEDLSPQDVLKAILSRTLKEEMNLIF